jgi:retinol-binding protein 3
VRIEKAPRQPVRSSFPATIVAFTLSTGCGSTDIHPSSASSSRLPPEGTQAEPPAQPDDPVGKKFEMWLSAINSGDRGRMERVWRDAPDAELGGMLDSSLAERTGGLELHHVEESTASEMLAVVRAKRTDRWLCLYFGVDPDEPHAIQMIMPRPTGAPVGPANGGASTTPFDGKAKGNVIDAIARELNRAYVFPEKASATERQIHTRQRQHAYDATTSRLGFARSVTEDIQSVTHDKHLRVEATCSQNATRSLDERRDPSPTPPAERRKIFGQTRRLDGNVAYIDVATFNVSRDQAKDEVRDTMSQAADAAAIIFDVRRNGGGEPETVALLISYLFGADPVHLNSIYWRIPARTDDFFTDPRVQGAKFGPTKPVYVLTSGRTFSGGEEFAYDLQALKRASIVGETTAGGAHPGDMVSLPRGFSMFVPNGRAINPVTKTDWEGTGVKPDVAAPSTEALATAHKLALAKIGAGSQK